MTENRPERKKPDVLAMIKKAAADTTEVLSSHILAPVVPGSKVRVRINGLVHELIPDDRQFEGWAVLQATGVKSASIIAPASAAQVKAYFELLPRFQLIALMDRDNSWWGIPSQTSDSRMQIFGAVRIRLPQRLSSFETINTRFDGSSFWFEDVARRRNPVIARQLREALANEIFPEDLQVPGVVPQERCAYTMMFFAMHPELIDSHQPEPVPQADEVKVPQNESPGAPTFDYQEWWSSLLAVRLNRAVTHAGARLDTYWRDSQGVVTVRMVVDKDLHVVQVQSRDLSVISSGICLSGMDSTFDLASLVGVLRVHKDMNR
ncbi:MAG: hypothetical protein K2W95_22295 [Candidatus Obscuribacterales bacterium]|nr:hypothetical protein [Candidatus Obscuribacterales bacterium]